MKYSMKGEGGFLSIPVEFFSMLNKKEKLPFAEILFIRIKLLNFLARDNLQLSNAS